MCLSCQACKCLWDFYKTLLDLSPLSVITSQGQFGFAVNPCRDDLQPRIMLYINYMSTRCAVCAREHTACSLHPNAVLITYHRCLALLLLCTQIFSVFCSHHYTHSVRLGGSLIHRKHQSDAQACCVMLLLRHTFSVFGVVMAI